MALPMTEDVLRLRFSDPIEAGFVAGFLRSRYGRPQLRGSSYGSVVVHIEPEHFNTIYFPRFGDAIVSKVGSKMKRAVECRDDANRLLGIARDQLMSALGKEALPTKPVLAGQRIMASHLELRLDASYHNARARGALSTIGSIKANSVMRISNALISVTKFRTRTYVDHGGIPMLSSKQVFQVDPVDIKRLAKGAHTKDLPEIALKENMVLVTRSGSVGKIGIVPRYMEAWTASEHVMRIVAADSVNPGYLYAWLASEYGQALLMRHAYGSVIIQLDRDQLGSVPVPRLSKSTENEIGDLVLKANKLRDEAWNLEREAITEIEETIEGKRQPKRDTIKIQGSMEDALSHALGKGPPPGKGKKPKG